MLKVLFTYDKSKPIYETLKKLHFQYNEDLYTLANENFKYSVTVLHHADNFQLEMQFSRELTLEQYKSIHLLINQLKTELDAIVDDSEALMGYLKDGKEAFIYHHWVEWYVFLEEARHESMVSQKVQVYDEQLLVGEGILIDVIKDELSQDDYRIVSCSIITKTGEKNIIGNLTIIPTGEF